MSAQPKVLNVTTGYRIKRSQANRRIEQFLSEWVERGVSIRNLTLAESVKMRSDYTRQREPLAFAELPGIVVRDIKTDHSLIHQAHEFAASQC